MSDPLLDGGWLCGAFMDNGFRCERPSGHDGDHDANEDDDR